MLDTLKKLARLEADAYCAYMDSESWTWKKNVREAEAAVAAFRNTHKWELIAAYGC